MAVLALKHRYFGLKAVRYYSSAAVSDVYDAIVVGGGHNGLVAVCNIDDYYSYNIAIYSSIYLLLCIS